LIFLVFFRAHRILLFPPSRIRLLRMILCLFVFTQSHALFNFAFFLDSDSSSFCFLGKK